MDYLDGKAVLPVPMGRLTGHYQLSAFAGWSVESGMSCGVTVVEQPLGASEMADSKC